MCPLCRGISGTRDHRSAQARQSRPVSQEREGRTVSDDKDVTATPSESENPQIPAPTAKAGGRPRTNRDWWPNQLDLSVLHRNSTKSNPMGPDFDYREEFKK